MSKKPILLRDHQGHAYDQDQRVIRPAGSHAFLAVVGGVAILVLSTACHGRLGHNIEDNSYVSHGPLRGHTVYIDGYDVYGTKIGAHPSRIEKLFDVRDLGIAFGPRGIEYIPGLNSFAFSDRSDPGHIYLSDHRGQPRSTIAVSYPEGIVPNHVEALAYIPKTSSRYPDSLVMPIYPNPPAAPIQLAFIGLDGTVLGLAVPDEPLASNFVAGLAYYDDAKLLASDGTNLIYTLDFDGHILGAPIPVEGTRAIEGLSQDRSGNIAVSDYFDGVLRVVDHELQLIPDAARKYELGVGVSTPVALEWNSDKMTYLVAHVTTTGASVSEVAPNFKRAQEVFSILVGTGNIVDLAYIPEERATAVLRGPTGTVELYDTTWTLLSTLDLSAYAPVVELDYVASQEKFAFVSGKPGEEKRVYWADRSGAVEGSVELAASELTGLLGLATVECAGELAFVASDRANRSSRLAGFTSTGEELWSINARDELGVIFANQLAAFEVGSHCALALVDANSSELVVVDLAGFGTY